MSCKGIIGYFCSLKFLREYEWIIVMRKVTLNVSPEEAGECLKFKLVIQATTCFS